jgi:hypothetical protein
MIERPQHYVFTLDDGDVAGFNAQNLQFQLDSDAPFRLLGIAIIGYLGSPAKVNMRFTRPDRSWMQRFLIPWQSINPYTADAPGATGTTTQPPPYVFASAISPNLLYPPNTVIVMDFQNTVGFNDITKIVFIGTKLFQDGAVWAPTYPASYRSLPFLDYNLLVFPPAFGAAPLLQVPFDIQPDADFVWQAGQHSSQATFASLTITIADSGGTLVFTAAEGGTGGNSITLDIVAVGANTPFSINVVGDAVTVELQTNGAGLPITTFAQFVAAMNSNPAVTALFTTMTPSSLASIVETTGGPLSFTGGADAGPSGGIGIRIRDYSGKYYSNDYVPVEILFGFDHSQAPGLVYPEIYVPKNQALYFDFSTLSGLVTPVAQLVLSFKGQKIYGS